MHISYLPTVTICEGFPIWKFQNVKVEREIFNINNLKQNNQFAMAVGLKKYDEAYE